MKPLKRILPILLAVALVWAMGVTAFAAETGSITVNNMETGKTYEIYRVFDMTLSGTAPNQTASYTIAPKWEGAFFYNGSLIASDFLLTAQPAGGSLNQIQHGGQTYYLNVTSSNVAAFANHLNNFLEGITADGSHKATAEDNGRYTFSNLDLGYYLLLPVDATAPAGQNTSVCSLTNTKPTATVSPKGEYPTVDKTVNDPDVEVGQVVTFTIKVPHPTESIEAYDQYWYKLTDTMSPGLTFGDSAAATNFTVKLKVAPDPTDPEDEGYDILLYGHDAGGQLTDHIINAANVTNNAGLLDFTEPENGFTLLFDIRPFVGVDGDIVITYDAVVNENAVVRYTRNLVDFDYGHDPDELLDGGNDETPVYSSEIIVEKYDAATENAATKTYLKDAKFVLYRVVSDNSAAGSHKEYYKYTAAVAASGTTPASPAAVTWINESAVANDWSNITVGTTGTDGRTNFSGLESGTYFLHETVAPDGYNKLTDDIQVVISAPDYASDDTNHTRPIGVRLTKPVANSGGSVLPETGGVGTTIFYALGSVLFVGAGVTLFVRRRMRTER